MREGGSAQVAVCGELRCREGGDDDGEMRMEILLLGQRQRGCGWQIKESETIPNSLTAGRGRNNIVQ